MQSLKGRSEKGGGRSDFQGDPFIARLISRTRGRGKRWNHRKLLIRKLIRKVNPLTGVSRGGGEQTLCFQRYAADAKKGRSKHYIEEEKRGWV